jgi:hypothetical protein
LPQLSDQLLRQASEPAAFFSFVGALGEGQHLAAFSDPAAAQPDPQLRENLSQILGSNAAQEEIVLRASSATGLSEGLLSQMIPVIASMIFGGLGKSMQNQGFGEILGQLANAAGQGGFGPIHVVLGGGPAPASPQPQPAPGSAGGLGGLGEILGKILGTGQGRAIPQQPGLAPSAPAGGILESILESLTGRSGAGPTAGPSAPAGLPQMPGFDPSSIQAGLEALIKMLQPGTGQPPSEQTASRQPAAPPAGGLDINAELDRITGGKRQ